MYSTNMSYKQQMRNPRLNLDKEFLKKEKLRKNVNWTFNLLYSMGSVFLWIKNYTWINFANNINSVNIEIIGKTTSNILLITFVGYLLTVIGLSKVFKVNNWILVIGIFGLITSSLLILGPILTWYDD